MKESYLKAPVINLFQNYKFFSEFSFYRRYIDLIGVKGEEIIAIELKIKDWKKALWQLLSAQLTANKVFLAIWHKFSKFVNYTMLKEFGFGLIEVNRKNARLIIPAKESSIRNISLFDETFRKLMGKNNHNA